MMFHTTLQWHSRYIHQRLYSQRNPIALPYSRAMGCLFNYCEDLGEIDHVIMALSNVPYSPWLARDTRPAAGWSRPPPGGHLGGWPWWESGQRPATPPPCLRSCVVSTWNGEGAGRCGRKWNAGFKAFFVLSFINSLRLSDIYIRQ